MPANSKKATPGVNFPADEKGARSTTAYGKAVMSASLKDVDDAASNAILAEKDWRFGYEKHFCATTVAATKSADQALKVAQQGLAYARGNVEFLREEEECSFAAALEQPTQAIYGTAKVAGTAKPKSAVEVPYKGKSLSGDALDKQLDAWAAYGVMEKSCAESAQAAAGNASWLDLSGRQFVVLGANSELGPLEYLLNAGAIVVAVATRRPERWRNLISLARKSAGKLVFPVKEGTDSAASDEDLAAAAGCDLAGETPELIAWLRSVVDTNESLTIGTYLYADGEANVRITLASDAIVEAFSSGKPGEVSFAWLGSPATALVVPKETVEDSKQRRAASSWYVRAMGYEHNEALEGGEGLLVHNGLASMQGPNYALAQQLRQWRAIELRAKGFCVSTNMAPPCRTQSVVSNKTMEKALDGMAYFAPNEAFDGKTAQAVMFLLLVADLRGKGPPGTVRHPLEIFGWQAFHGGGWRCPWRMESFGKSSYILGTVWPSK